MLDPETRKKAMDAILAHATEFEVLRDLAVQAGMKSHDIPFPHGHTPYTLTSELVSSMYNYGVLDKLIELTKKG
jgi:hypothetical protein